MTVRHLRLAGGAVRPIARNADDPASEICLIDYSHCSERDTCWVLDLGANCEGHDGCLIDTG